MEVYDSTGTNVALNKVAVQSSTYSTFPASKAVNGALDDFSHTNQEQGESCFYDSVSSNNMIVVVL